MQKLFILTTMVLFAAATTGAQGKRYKDLIFAKADVSKDRSYAADTVKSDDKKDYLFDLYTPHGDAERNRPLVIWMHGGGFVFGSKNDENIKLWSETFARRGYVCAAIDYRLGKKTTLFSFDKLIQGAYPAVLDTRQAVRYFKENAKQFGIDPNRIVLAGNSAGGMMGLQTAFINNRELADSLRIKNPAAFGSVSDGPTKVMAVVNFWGGIYNINWLKNAPTPVVSAYGSTDKIVHPGVNKGIYGGEAITGELKKMSRTTDSKVFDGYGHELHKHFNPLPLHPDKDGIKERWLAAGQFAADFLAKLLQ